MHLSEVVNVKVVDVHHDGYGLTNDQRDPYGHIAVMAVQKLFHKGRERYLHYHAQEGPEAKHSQRYAH